MSRQETTSPVERAERLVEGLVADPHARAILRAAIAQAVADAERRAEEAERELERWRHGALDEGDFVCPASLALDAAERRAEEAEREVRNLRESCRIAADAHRKEGDRAAALSDRVGVLEGALQNVRDHNYDARYVHEVACAALAPAATPTPGSAAATRDSAGRTLSEALDVMAEQGARDTDPRTGVIVRKWAASLRQFAGSAAREDGAPEPQPNATLNLSMGLTADGRAASSNDGE